MDSTVVSRSNFRLCNSVTSDGIDYSKFTPVNVSPSRGYGLSSSHEGFGVQTRWSYPRVERDSGFETKKSDVVIMGDLVVLRISDTRNNLPIDGISVVVSSFQI